MLLNSLPTRQNSAGVSQGSELDPTLFNIYISDIPRCPFITLALNTDDTAILGKSENVKFMYERLEHHLNIIEP